MAELIKIVGQYAPETNMGPRLVLTGPLDRESIDKVIQRHRPYTFSPEYAEGKGGATFLVSNEPQASQLVKVLNAELANYHIVIEYHV